MNLKRNILRTSLALFFALSFSLSSSFATKSAENDTTISDEPTVQILESTEEVNAPDVQILSDDSKVEVLNSVEDTTNVELISQTGIVEDISTTAEDSVILENGANDSMNVVSLENGSMTISGDDYVKETRAAVNKYVAFIVTMVVVFLIAPIVIIIVILKVRSKKKKNKEILDTNEVDKADETENKE